MKAILISDHAKWCALMMNGDKTVEVRKGTALYKAIQKLIDEYGYADIYVYCTKGNYDIVRESSPYSSVPHYVCVKIDKKLSKELPEYEYSSSGKVIFKFRCYKVEEITQVIRARDSKIMLYRGLPKGINNKPLMNESCLSFEEMKNYLGYENGIAIHISDLEIFDKPKELYELHKPLGSYDCNHNCGGGCNMCWCEGWETRFHFECEIQKAPQSWCYVESEK